MKPTMQDLLTLLESDLELDSCERIAQLMGIPAECFDMTPYRKTARHVYDSSSHFDIEEMIVIFFPDMHSDHGVGYSIYDSSVWLGDQRVCLIDDVFAVIPPKHLDLL